MLLFLNISHLVFSNKMLRIKNFLRNNWVLLCILGLAILLRVVYILIFRPPLIWSDSPLYDGTAWNFVSGFGYSLMPSIPYAGREPGYALFFLVPIYYIFGHSILAVQIFQIILSVCTIVLIYMLANKFFGVRIALVAALIYTTWTSDIAYTNEILTEIPFTFLLLCSVYVFTRAIETNSKIKMFVSGVLLGMATLTRFITVLYPFIIFAELFLIFKAYKKTLRYFVLLFLGFSIFVMPWFARNYIQFDKFIFGRTGSWDMYWSGSYVPWDGDWLGNTTPPLSDWLKEKSTMEYENTLKVETIRNIKDNPLGVLWVYAKKPFKIFFRPAAYPRSSIARNDQLQTLFNVNYIDVIIKWGIRLMHIFIMAMALYGAIYILRLRGIKIFIVQIVCLIGYYATVLLPLNTDARYQIPMMPYIIMFSAFGLVHLFGRIKVIVTNMPNRRLKGENAFSIKRTN